MIRVDHSDEALELCSKAFGLELHIVKLWRFDIEWSPCYASRGIAMAKIDAEHLAEQMSSIRDAEWEIGVISLDGELVHHIKAHSGRSIFDAQPTVLKRSLRAAWNVAHPEPKAQKQPKEEAYPEGIRITW